VFHYGTEDYVRWLQPGMVGGTVLLPVMLHCDGGPGGGSTLLGFLPFIDNIRTYWGDLINREENGSKAYTKPGVCFIWV
jgi:hypothetical protein